jgi:hypothetical protein
MSPHFISFFCGIMATLAPLASLVSRAFCFSSPLQAAAQWTLAEERARSKRQSKLSLYNLQREG